MRMQRKGVRVVAGLVMLASACVSSGPGPVMAGSPTGSGASVDAAAAERGRVALTLNGLLKPEWSEGVYRDAARLWD
jgi:hypothetical protein